MNTAPFDSNEAADCADMVAIQQDVEQSLAAAGIFLSGRFDDGGEDNRRVRHALYESALISYRRAFDTGSSRHPRQNGGTWRIPKAQLAAQIGARNDDHKEILRLAGKCIAHRSCKDAGQVEIFDVESDRTRILYRKLENPEIMTALTEILEGVKMLLLSLVLKQIEECKKTAAKNGG